jgi:hypothetical protein
MNRYREAKKCISSASKVHIDRYASGQSALSALKHPLTIPSTIEILACEIEMFIRGLMHLMHFTFNIDISNRLKLSASSSASKFVNALITLTDTKSLIPMPSLGSLDTGCPGKSSSH